MSGYKLVFSVSDEMEDLSSISSLTEKKATATSMGGGGLRILGHKSWHVWRRDNIERVLRDERQQQEEQQSARDKQRRSEQERRAHLLRTATANDDDAAASNEQNTAGVRLFALEEQQAKHKLASAESARKTVAAQETLGKQAALPWYAKAKRERPDGDEQRTRREQKRKRCVCLCFKTACGWDVVCDGRVCAGGWALALLERWRARIRSDTCGRVERRSTATTSDQQSSRETRKSAHGGSTGASTRAMRPPRCLRLRRQRSGVVLPTSRRRHGSE